MTEVKWPADRVPVKNTSPADATVVDVLAVIGWMRVLLLAACLGGAAWLDLRTRRVPNGYWLQWARPALFLWGVELAVRDADWTVWLTASAVTAWASVSLIGTPALADLRKGALVDWVVATWYAISAVGLVAGVLRHGMVVLGDPLGLFAETWTAELEATRPWLEVLAVGLVIGIVEVLWRMRLIHGGADAKGTMLVALMLPWWTTIPMLEGRWLLPPAIALYLWGGLFMLAIPVLNMVQNVRAGDAIDWRRGWFAIRLPLEEVGRRQVWLLDEVVETVEGEQVIRTRTRAKRRANESAYVARQVEALGELGAERAWVTQKWPFMVFMLAAVPPVLLFGDAMAWIVPWLVGWVQ